MSAGTTAVPLSQDLDARIRNVDTALDRWLPTTLDSTPRLAEAMRYAVFPGGKRLRPMLVLLSCEACGGSDDAAMPAACAVELVHCYSLVHDDLPAMDDDDLRRGRPTCHKVFGEAIAILTGDALLTIAFEIVAKYSPRAEFVAASCRELALAAGSAGMVGGQVDDLAAEVDSAEREPSIETIQSIHARKTGALLRASVRLGGFAADASSEELAALDGYGSRIGLAFQIADDLLDVCGEEAATGKRVGKDRGRGKLTFPGVVGAERSRELSRDLIRDAIARLDPLGPRAERLRELARFIVERDH